jgi:NAD(P)-dependent dehydrogenase (short-subunit alcohol dehydrogenase family)
MAAKPVPTALIIGGGGALGARLCERVLEGGLVERVVSMDLRHPEGDADARIERVDVDATDRAAFRAALDRSLPEGAGVRVLVNCLGVSPKKDGRKVPIREITTDDWNTVFSINVLAPLIAIQESWDRFVDGETAIVNILSLVAKTGSGGRLGTRHGVPSPAGAHYSASKAALGNLTLSLARELGPSGIRVNAVSPGQIEGGMRGSVQTDDVDLMVAEVPLGRAADYREIVDAVEYLLSDRSSYITGELLDVNGGWVAD